MLGELWRLYQPRLLTYLRACEPAAAEDVASETWLSVARDLSGFEGDESGFRGWLFTVARRRLIDHRRARGRRPEVLADPWSTPMFLGRVAADRTDPAEEAARSSATASAVGLISTLPPDQAEVVLLRVIADLDVPAVASIVGKQPGAVRVLCHRGLRRLAERLGDHDQPEFSRSGVTEP